jgi:hypothetical protein
MLSAPYVVDNRHRVLAALAGLLLCPPRALFFLRMHARRRAACPATRATAAAAREFALPKSCPMRLSSIRPRVPRMIVVETVGDAVGQDQNSLAQMLHSDFVLRDYAELGIALDQVDKPIA